MSRRGNLAVCREAEGGTDKASVCLVRVVRTGSEFTRAVDVFRWRVASRTMRLQTAEPLCPCHPTMPPGCRLRRSPIGRAAPLLPGRGTGFQPVKHGRDGRAISERRPAVKWSSWWHGVFPAVSVGPRTAPRVFPGGHLRSEGRHQGGTPEGRSVLEADPIIFVAAGKAKHLSTPQRVCASYLLEPVDHRISGPYRSRSCWTPGHPVTKRVRPPQRATIAREGPTRGVVVTFLW